jgi:hypothetical protein
VFAVLYGQCDFTMRTKIEGITNPSFKEIQEQSKVLIHVKVIKDFTFSTQTIEYEYWVTAKTLKKLINMRSQPKEEITSFHKKWASVVEALEGKWGNLIPTKD